MAALLTWAWARIPELLGDSVDLADTERVRSIVAMVELHEFGQGAAPAEPDPELEQALADAAAAESAHPGGPAAADNGEPV